MSGGRGRLVDLALALVVTALNVGMLVGIDDPRGGLAANLVYPIVVGVLVAVRRVLPVGTGLAFVAASLAQASFLLVPSELAGAFLCLLIFPYTAGAHGVGRRSLTVLPAIIALYCIVELSGDGIALTDVVFPFVLVTASFFAGRGVQSRTRLAAELHEQAVRAEEARELEARSAIAAERRRIARELHDVVAHSISVMVVQAGGARRILDRDRERAHAAAEQIERTGREALVEMRRLLGALNPTEEGPARAPQPGLDAVERLLERARDAGLPVTVHVEGDRREVPPGLELTAYRILQEALTNAMKHAAAAPTEVWLRWSPDALEIRVADRGTADAPPDPPEGGHGIIGMRERVRLYGGDLEAGPRDAGGFEVRARLPLQAEEVTA